MNRVGGIVMVLRLALEQMMKGVLLVGLVKLPTDWMEPQEVTMLHMVLVKAGGLILVKKDMLSESCWSLLLKGLSTVWLDKDESVAVMFTDTTVQGYRYLA